MQNIDVLFDFPHAQLGLYARETVEKLTP